MIVLALFVAVIVLGVDPRRLLRRRRVRTEASGDQALLFLELVALGVSGGLSFTQSAALAADEVGGATGAIASKRLRGRSIGDRGPLALLFAAAERAAVTGAPLLAVLDGQISELRGEQRQARLERIRKLPVKLLFPLAFLVLPGFLLLTVGPVVAGSLERLGL